MPGDKNAMNAVTKYEYDRIPYMIVFQEKSNFKDTYAGRMDFVGHTKLTFQPVRVFNITQIDRLVVIQVEVEAQVVGGIAK